MNYFYSAKLNAFYPDSLQEEYAVNDSWPDDAVEIEDSVYQEFAADEAPEGKIRVAGDDGLPAWDDIPVPTQEEQIAKAEDQKQRLLTEAATAIAPLQDAVDLGMATDEEKAHWLAWKKYRVLLNRVDTSKAPDIDWPVKPE
ncbi:phage tail protein [Citrobacter amalonaticus]|uniref:Phage tail protein n=1 Tax=Citrobacter amalonaticus TaxID=35703 RepID=A0A2S4RTE8_CITAM|nr:tail fiber assembly protein [Citrobacter amalonaticus]POT56837.1 phage tail protein [Citrobacter amalonaticus]POT71918.1 phage tail protein [Citrobacter amalonaticus]POU63057.1 phage tail protein [Citrobacter amalonaticus]POV04729.1 phage tail protein [Citrobacter amalonaticus]